MRQPQIFNIQRFSTHDGAGIRTTVFFKGCPLRCEWCHNPESQRPEPELVTYPSKCVSCGRCVNACPQGCIRMAEGELGFLRENCTACGRCTEACLHEARELAGKEMTVGELIKEIMKDRLFYDQSGGGVTLSGGEVMVQNMDYVELLCKRLFREGISVNIDTCGYAPYENFRRLLPYTDTFLYDMKLLDPEEHRRYTGVENEKILSNLRKLSEDGAKIVLRIPTIGGVNATEGFMKGVISFLSENGIRIAEVDLLPYHDIGKGKYRNLGRDYHGENMTVPSGEQMETFRLLFEKAGYHAKTGG